TGKVQFLQADFANMKELFCGYDLILLNDVVDQIYQPNRLLSQIHERLNEQGILVLATAWDWDAGKTKPANWLGGFRSLAEPVRGMDTVESILKDRFERIGEIQTFPYVIRINKRKSVLKMVEATVWQKK
ncbi:MAG: class I SAM-dependent methyltransferase, partial [Marinilabiliales bacterium]|nr:class I SAM-dependent methyltransferase [Marinilabiliales bacterium]